MKNITRIFLITAVIILSVSCTGRDKKPHRDPSQGAAYELLVVCPQDKWEGEVGDTLKSILQQEVEGLSQSEPLYDVLRILPNSFSSLLQKNRNIIIVQTGPELTKAVMTAQYDVYAAPQIIVSILGPDDKAIVQYMSEHRHELQEIFEMAERDRSLVLNKRYGDVTIEKEINDLFGFNMSIPKGYKVRNTIPDKNFMWISFEYPTASQGIIIYSYPYSGREDFSVDSLMSKRNQFVSLIPGENPGSHMTTFDEYIPPIKHLRINGRYWGEMRGFWDVKNDFMGGPFVSYSTLDTDKKMVITLDFYVFSPDKSKRNFMRLLEHLIYSVKFPADEEMQKGSDNEENAQ